MTRVVVFSSLVGTAIVVAAVVLAVAARCRFRLCVRW